jgi:hypothetical protein
MLSTRTRSVLLVTALSVAAFALQTETADAQKRTRTTSAQRDAWIEHCIAKAQAETPFFTQQQGGYRRADIYKNCMFQAGMRP